MPSMRTSRLSTWPAAWLADQIIWGARALVAVEGLWAHHLMDAWDDTQSSLRYP